MTRILIKLIFGLVCLQQQLARSNGQCMPAENCAFLDCCCEMRGSFVYVSCKSQYKDDFPIRNPQSTSSSDDIRYIEISGYKFEELPSKSFDGLRISQLDITNNQYFKIIKSDSFVGLTSVQFLTLTGHNVTKVEARAFDPLRNVSVMTLSNQMTIDSVLLNSGEFSFLKSLYLSSFIKLNSNWFVNTPELISLRMYYYPKIVEYPPPDGFFVSNPRLVTIDISNNFMTDLAPVLNWLRNVKDQLRILDLNFNQIQVIPEEINDFTRLDTLLLWQNPIRNMTSETFRGLKELTRLEISFSEISESPIDAFKHNSKLQVINMDSSKLKRIHDLPQSARYINYQSQWGYLEELYDYQFDLRPPYSLLVYIGGNDFLRFGNQTFCSRTDASTLAPITLLGIDYASLARMNLCLLRQLGLRNTDRYNTISVRNDALRDISQLCNCEFILFLDYYKLTMVADNCRLELRECKLWSNVSIIEENVKQIDADCATRQEFECHPEQPATESTSTNTESTTPNTRAATTTKNFAPLKLHLNLKIFFAGLFFSILFLNNSV